MNNEKKYKSPRRKLVKFFENSRDKWKEKCLESKAKGKQLSNRVRFLEDSKGQLKNEIKSLKLELAKSKSLKKTEEIEIEAQKKKLTDKPTISACIKPFDYFPFHHKYSLGHIMIFITLVLTAATSFRCTSRVFEIMMTSLELPLLTPSWYSGRLWLLRVGYYKLTRQKEKANDWVWIVDHTVQIGADKCFVILGIRLCSLPPRGNCVTHEDVEPISLYPVKQSNGEIVYQQLEETIKKTGVPREIIGDQGSDLAKGIKMFCENHKEVCYIYDIKHKTANVLKHELENDEKWLEFVELAAKTKLRVQQTSLAFLSPPNQRTKSRYMNVDILIRWGSKILAFLDKQQEEKSNKFDLEQLQEKLGWITKFRDNLKEFEDILQIIEASESFVRKNGLDINSHIELKEIMTCMGQTERTKKVRELLIAFVEEESSKAKPNERLLGSSEVIESVFGKLKRLENDQAKSGFTGLILSTAAMVSKTTKDVVENALKTVPTKEVLVWLKSNIGQSLQSMRKEAFASCKKTEQKRDQILDIA
jgi:hypothetical protein